MTILKESTSMKTIGNFILYFIITTTLCYAQEPQPQNSARQSIYVLIEKYQQARQTKDSVLLDSVLASDIDQLVSSGIWRNNRTEAFDGMMRSSTRNPGKRRLSIEKLRFLTTGSAIVDCIYELPGVEHRVRKMWSTFILVSSDGRWKITAIRNMLPAKSP